jgi:peptidoglycan/LPS O-acetylase OafA/YrhL
MTAISAMVSSEMRIQVRVFRREPKTMRIWERIGWPSGEPLPAGSGRVFSVIACLVRHHSIEALLPAARNANLLRDGIDHVWSPAMRGLTNREPILGKVRPDANEARMGADSQDWEAHSARHAPGASAFIGYRPDIDGLRALAVLPVLAFHFNIPYFGGGFVGVDVFFVISGYLITGILLKDFGTGRPGWLGRFYMRRIRRILPAFLAMTLLTLLTGSVLLFPGELAALGRNALAALFFASNLYLHAETNYFAAGSEANAFLHTWSLAVEEQFYLLYPPLLYLLHRFARARLPVALLALAVLSFLLCVDATDSHPQAAFYLPAYRVWELAAGGLLAALPGLTIRNRVLGEGLAIGGIVLILGATYLYYKKMLYPGVWAAAPVAGALLLIMTGSGGRTLASRLLSARPAVHIGRISYSLYLVHWPLFVFTHLALGRVLHGAEQAGLLLLSLALAHLSWRFVERPFRVGEPQGDSGHRRLVLRFAGPVAAAAAVALSLSVSGGFPGRFAPEVERLASYARYDDVPVYRRGTCFIDAYQQGAEDFRTDPCLTRDPARRNVLLIGDSHAAHLWKALEEGLPGVHVLQMTASGCKPFLVPVGVPACSDLITRAFEQTVPGYRYDGVILAGEWGHDDLPYLEGTLDHLKRFTPHVYLAGPIVAYNQSLARLLARSEAWGRAMPGPEAQGRNGAALDSEFAAFAHLHGVTYLSTYRALCATPETCLLKIGDVPVQWDNSHLTAEGARRVVSAFMADGDFAAVVQ